MFILWISIPLCLLSAENEGKYHFKALTSFSTGDHTPFWMVTNTYGLMPLKDQSGYFLAGATQNFKVNSSLSFQIGMDMAAAYGHSSDVYLHQLYGALKYKKIQFSIGSMERNSVLVNNDLGTGSMTMSRNARPIPEFHVGTTDFIYIPYTFDIVELYADFGVGKFMDWDYNKNIIKQKEIKDYTKEILSQHKSLYVRLSDPRGKIPFKLTAGVEHYAQWGGNTTVKEYGKPAGKLPHGFDDFWKIFFGKEGGSNSMETDQANKLGNHLGTFSFRLDYENEYSEIGFYWSHFFEDGSGMNISKWLKDGLLGVEVKLKKNPWLHTILYEYLITKNQSGPIHYIHEKPHGAVGSDNYYNNGVYTQGWSYYGRAIGNALLTSPEYYDGIGFINNRVKAHHLGVKGDITERLNYKLRISYSLNYGLHRIPFLHVRENLYTGLEMDYQIFKRDPSWNLGLNMGYDHGKMIDNSFGVAVSLSKTGIFWK